MRRIGKVLLALGAVAVVTALVVSVLLDQAGEPPPTRLPSPQATTSPRPSPDRPSPDPIVTAEPGSDVVELVVDGRAAGASDDNPGTAERPLASIAEAAVRVDAANRAGDPVHVRIWEGTYRESVDLTPSGSATDAEIVIEGEGQVILSGSEPYTGWKSEDDQVYRHAWDRDWGQGDVAERWLEEYGGEQLAENPVIRRREMVFVDGELLVPHTAAGAMRQETASFHVDEDADLVRIHLPDGVTPDGATIEVAERETLLVVEGRRNVTIANMTLQHAASRPQGRALTISNSDRVTVRDVTLLWNSWGGLSISNSRNVTIDGTVANHNGVAGMNGTRSSDVLVVDSETSHNNWRGVRGAEGVEPGTAVDRTFVDYAAGQKFLYMRRMTFRRHTAVGNMASGLWFDFDNRDITIEDSLLRDNLTWGLFLEASPGPFTLEGLQVCGNEVGIHIANSASGTLSGSVLAGNTLSHLYVGGREKRSVVDAETDQSYEVTSQDWVVEDNTFATTDGQVVYTAGARGGAWRPFVESLRASDNRFVGPVDRVVEDPDGTMSLDQWQGAGHDAGATGQGAAGTADAACDGDAP